MSLVTIVRDITDRKKAEEALQESELKFRLLVENSPNLVAIYQDGVLKYVNRSMCERLGWSFEEMTSPFFSPIEKLVPQRFHALAKEVAEKRLRGERIPPFEFTVKARDGSEIPCMDYSQKIVYRGKPAVEVLLVDITERKQVEAEKAAVMNQVARSIAHDIHNPLSAIRLAAHILKDATGERRQEMLKLIDSNIASADRIIEPHRFFLHSIPYAGGGRC